jgi:hypothetical protein
MIALAPSVTVTPTSDGATILDERTGRLFHLNRTAAAILREVLHGGEGWAAEHLCEVYRLDPRAARTDVSKLMDDLSGRGLVDRT